MVVSITWSLQANGDSIAENEWSPIEAGHENTSTRFYIRHDGANEITSCGFYLRPVQEGYTGSNSPLGDYQELLSWGDSDKGVRISFDNATYVSHSNSVGYDASHVIELPGEEIAAGSSASVYLKLNIPSAVTAGIRQFDHVLRYLYTS